MEYQKTYLLATANVQEVSDDELYIPEPIQLAQATDIRGKVPVVPTLENQKDLTKLVAVLFSTGINRNDDVFLSGEILPARNTGAHKPVNMEHDPKQIVGHMLRTFATEKGGRRVPDNAKPKEKRFDITAEAVLYSFLFPGLVRDIKDRAQANELFVSVEVWFTAFDFAVGNRVVKRTPETASSLEPRLKINGGSGNFEGQRLGRVLRNIIIGGIGVVKDPANPESIIKSVSSFDSEVVQDIEDEVISAHVICDFSTSDVNETVEVADNSNVIEVEGSEIMNPELIEEMAALASAIKAKADESGDTEVAEINVDETNPQLQALASRMDALEKQNRELERKADEAEFRAEAAHRSAALREAGIPESMVDRHISRCFNMTRDQFENYCADLIETVNTVILGQRATASTAVAEETETETTETAEGGDAADAGDDSVTVEDNVETETAEVETETAEETNTAEVETEVAEPADETVETVEDEVEIEIEAVDPDLQLEGDQETARPSLTEQMGDIVQQFLKHKDKKWENLALRK